MNDKIITHGEAHAIQILVARDLNLEIGMVGLAEKYLKEKDMQPVLIGTFAKEAAKAVSMIQAEGLTDEAQKLAGKYVDLCK
ncbi:MAG: hypothetical protein LBS20_11605 [Prevotella sp.]|jgi:hypothetical protein|nr:hypothetical protein [Prevotella sp.]